MFHLHPPHAAAAPLTDRSLLAVPMNTYQTPSAVYGQSREHLSVKVTAQRLLFNSSFFTVVELCVPGTGGMNGRPGQEWGGVLGEGRPSLAAVLMKAVHGCVSRRL